MNLKTMGWALGLFGQLLIALCFFAFFELQNLIGIETCWLDFVVVSLVYWALISTFFRHPIDLDDPSGKQAAGLGLKWQCLKFYCITAIAVVGIGIYANMDGSFSFPFRWQLLTQIVLLFVALVWLYVSASVTSFAGKVHADQQQTMSGKVNLKIDLADLVEASQANPGVPADVQKRIATLSAEIRFLSPSKSAEATALDARITDEVRALSLALTDSEVNSERIASLLSAIERHFARRKQTY